MALEFIKESWGDRFPGPQPISIERRHFPLLKKQPYFLCEKTDGVRHLLVSIADGVFLINRALVQTPVRGVRIPKETLLDGDLVESKNGKFIFVIHDAVRVKGEDIRLGPLDARLDKARGLVKGIIKTAGAPFEIRVKTMIRLEQAREFPSLESFDYETDGVVLTPVKEPIRTGTHETMFKWKPRDRITIDFELRMGNELYIQENQLEWQRCIWATNVRILRPGRLLSVGMGISDGLSKRSEPTRPIRTISGLMREL